MSTKILRYNSLESTMDKAKQLLANKSKNLAIPFVIVADEQTSGRGSYGKNWYSEDFGGLYYTLVCDSQKFSPQHHQETLTKIVTLLSLIINKFTSLQTEIKLPNDLMINGKKVGGILVETRTPALENGAHRLIIGIGLNINQAYFPHPLENIATSLYIEKGETFSKDLFIQAITQTLIEII